MERLAVIVGLLIAGGFVISSLVGDDMHVSWDFGDEPTVARPAAPEEIFNVAEEVYAAVALKITDAAVRVEVIPEDRSDLAVAVANDGPLATPSVRVDGDRVIVDGGARSVSCRNDGAHIRGVGYVAYEDLPIITVRAPLAVDVIGEGAAHFEIGDAGSFKGAFAGCGDVSVGDVSGPVDVRVAGSGDFEAQSGAAVSILLAGSSTAAIGAARDGLDVSVTGSGEVEAGAVSGPLEVQLAGSGDVNVEAAAVTRLDVTLAGSGDVRIEGDIEGPADLTLRGSGDIAVSGEVNALSAIVQGSGDIVVGGARGRVSQTVQGSGSVTVGAVTAEATTGERSQTVVRVREVEDGETETTERIEVRVSE